MPAVIPLAVGYVAGVAAGLFSAPAPWLLSPAAAAVSCGAWRRWPFAALLCLGVAAGALWGGGARATGLACTGAPPARCAAPSEPSDRRAGLQRAARVRLERLFGPRSTVAAALTVDPEARIAREQREVFRRSGLMHILSISGFHVGILAGALLLALRALRLPQAAARISGTVAVAGYIWLIGVPAPAVRAAALLALWSWGRVRQRPSSAGACIAVTALAVVTIEPGAVAAPGPWLSFAGAWGCVAAAAWWREAARGTPALARTPAARLLLQPVAVSIGTTLATAPVTILAFGTTTPAAIVANVAAVPLAAGIVPAIALALAVAAPGGDAALALAGIPAAAADLGLAALERVAAWAGGIPHATVTFEHRALAAAAALLVAWLVLRRPARAARPRRAPALLAGRVVPAGLLALGALAWSPVLDGATRSRAPQGPLTLHFLPVGQGDGTAIRTPGGSWIVIDGGPRVYGRDAGARLMVPFLRRQGARRLAVLVATHGDADHLGGVPAVLRALPADLVLEPGEPDGRPLYREFLAGAALRAGRWHPARAGESLAVDGVMLRVWHPDSAWLARREAPNENSVVLTVEYGAFRAAFPGDAGLPMEAVRAAAIGDVTLLKVGHHGSRTATGDAWLRALRPEHCVIPVGRNDYGHPDAGVVAALERDLCAVWRTDRHGRITVETDGRAVRVTAALGDAATRH